MKKSMALLLALLLLAAGMLMGCSPKANTVVKIFDTELSYGGDWDKVPDEQDHRITLNHKMNQSVSVNLTCFTNTTTLDVTGEAYATDPELNMMEYHKTAFTTGRENVKIEKEEVLRTKTAPMIHIRLSFDADGSRYVHDRYVFVHNNREYGLTGSWPEAAADAQIAEAEKVIASLVMK